MATTPEGLALTSRRKHPALSLALSIGVAIAGCGGGDGLPRRPVEGAVTLDGEPLAEGRIEFQPLGPGVPAGASIERGSYRVDEASGPIPGRYRVNISAIGEVKSGPGLAEGRTAGEPPGKAGPVASERIPPRYNAASILTVEIKPDGADRFDFALESKAGPGSPPSPR